MLETSSELKKELVDNPAAQKADREDQIEVLTESLKMLRNTASKPGVAEEIVKLEQRLEELKK